MAEDFNYDTFTRAFQWSRDRLAPFRAQRENVYKLLAGSRYGEFSVEKSNPIPYLKLLHRVYIRSLVASSPRCMITTKVPELSGLASAMEIAINHRIRDCELVSALKTAVSDALVCMGILKVGVCYYPMENANGTVHDYMKTYVDAISLDDWCHDMRATRFDQCAFMGHRQQLAREVLLNDPRLDPARVKDLPRARRHTRDEQGNLTVSSLSTGPEDGHDGEMQEYVEVWEFYLPLQQRVILMGAQPGGRLLTGKPLWEQEYIGPEKGPYHLLRFGELADNVLPSPPVTDQADMHEILNGSYRKFARRVLDAKEIYAATGGNEEDAKRINTAKDGETVRVDSQAPAPVPYFANPGPMIAAIMQFQKDGSYYAGGLDALAGLGPQSPTLGQDQLLAASASKNVQSDQETTINVTKNVMRDLAWYWWVSPETYHVTAPAQDGFPEMQSEPITREMREGYWLDLNFDVNPYSLQSESPGSKLNTLTQILTQIILPAAPLMQAQNIAVNWQETLREIGHLANMSSLEKILIFQAPPATEELQEPPQMPQSTSRTYNRTSRSEATVGGDRQATQMAAMGAASSQQAAMAGVPQ